MRRGRGMDGGKGGGKGEREGRKGMAGPIPNPLLRVCLVFCVPSAVSPVGNCCSISRSSFRLVLDSLGVNDISRKRCEIGRLLLCNISRKSWVP